MLTIKQLHSLAPGSPVIGTRGKIIAVSPYQSGNTEGQDWTLQSLFLQDDTGEIPVKVGNHPDFTQEAVGVIFVFKAHKKVNGGLTGLKIEEEPYVEEGTTKIAKVLVMARSGIAMTLEEEQRQTKAAAPAPGADIPVGTFAKSAVGGTTDPTPTMQTPATNPVNPVNVVSKSRMVELRYERTVNTGNYCSEKLGVTICLDENTKGEFAYKAAKSFVDSHLPPEAIPPGGNKV